MEEMMGVENDYFGKEWGYSPRLFRGATYFVNRVRRYCMYLCMLHEYGACTLYGACWLPD